MNFNGYVSMFAKYSELYRKQTNKNFQFGLEYQLFTKLLERFYDDNSGETTSEFGFIEYMLTLFNSKQNLSNFVRSAGDQAKEKAIKNKTKEVLNKIESITEPVKNKKENIKKEEPKEDYTLKFKSYAEFAINSAIEESNQEVDALTQTKNIYNRENLVDMFNAKNFYALNKTQTKELFQNVVSEYCLSNGVEPCKVVYEDLPASSKTICYGQYNPASGEIAINKKILNLLSKKSLTKNQYLPYQILTTLVHESRHRVQFANINNTNASEDLKLVTKSFMQSQKNKTHSQYLAELDEIDARNAALQYIRETSLNTDNQVLQAFYNQKKKEEINNGKENIDENLKPYFTDVYDNKFIQCNQKNIFKTEKRDFLNLLLEQPTLQMA